MLRLAVGVSFLAAALGAASPASAATIYVFVDPMTLEKKAVKVDPDGPDKAYLCMLPPATSGCQLVEVKRQRG